MLTDALLAPAAAGVNVTDTLQLAPAAIVAPQVLVWLNSVAFVPTIPMLETVSPAVPLLVTVTVCATLFIPTVCPPNFTLSLHNAPPISAAFAPVPLNPIECGDPVALSV